MEKEREFQKTSLTMWITTNYRKFLKRWEFQTIYLSPEKLVCGNEATVRILYGTADWFKIEKGFR